jgi:hypothetical protein
MGKKSAWLHGPAVDVALLAFPWVPFLIAYRAYDWLSGSPVCELADLNSDLRGCGSWMVGFYFFTNAVLYVHRHYTFGIIYSDPEERARHRRAYAWAPVVALLVLAPFACYRYVPHAYAPTMRLLFALIAAPQGAWAAYHVLMQRYGFLRAYAVKLGYGNPRLEKGLLFSWAALFISLIACWYRDNWIAVIEQGQGIRIPWAAPLFGLLGWLWVPAIAPAAYFSARWLVQEARQGSPASLPKWLMALSTLAMMVTFRYSILIGYMVFVVSHSIEYLAFVNLYARRKDNLRRWARAPLLANAAMFAGVGAIYALCDRHSAALAYGYTVAGGYLHYYLDGRLWRLREPRTRALVVGPLGAGQAAPEAL